MEHLLFEEDNNQRSEVPNDENPKPLIEDLFGCLSIKCRETIAQTEVLPVLLSINLRETETAHSQTDKLASEIKNRLDGKENAGLRSALSEFLKSPAGRRNEKETEAVLKQIDRLLFSKETVEDNRVNAADRKLLAEQCLRLATNPLLCSQGRFNTCEMATMEKLLWHREPSTVIDVIATAALSGTIKNYDGKPLRLSTEPFKKDLESKTASPSKGDRLFSSQIFQTVLVEREWKDRDIGLGPLRYELRKPRDSKDSGERLVSGDGRILWEKDDNQPINDPGIDFSRISRIYKSIAKTPIDKNPLVFSATDSKWFLPKGDLPGMKFVDLTKDSKKLEEALSEMSRNKQFPVIAVIAVGRGDERDLHVVTLNGYDTRQRKVSFHDQNEKSDKAILVNLEDLRSRMATDKLKPWQLPKPTVKLVREK